MKAYRLNQASASILLLAVLFFGLIPVQSANADAGAWTITGPLSTIRLSHTATLLNNGKVLVAGGGNLAAELYDPNTGTWTNTGVLHAARSYHTATLLANGKVLVVGGLSGTTSLSTVEIYDPGTGLWTIVSPMSTPRYFHTATRLSNGQVLVVGGHNKIVPGSYDSAELYDPTSNTWTPAGSLSTPRESHSAALLTDGRVLVAGGTPTGNFHVALKTAELYDPTTGTWTLTGSMFNYRVYHTATLLPNGQVLIAGGSDRSTYVASSELYDPSTGLWSTAGSLSHLRYFHTATLLTDINGNISVLVVGGLGPLSTMPPTSGALSSTELYDPIAKTWADTGPLNNARSNHSILQLYDGLVLAAGGAGASGNLSSAELYDPTPPGEVPLAPVKISPNGSTNTRPSYLWNYSNGASGYSLVVKTGAGVIVIDTMVDTSFCSGGVCTYHPFNELPNGNYKFNVRARNAAGYSVASPDMAFVVNGDLILSGNAGVAGVTLTYFDVKLKTTASGTGGDFSFPVSYNWHGTITPSKPGYTFDPTSWTPSSPVTTNLTVPDFTATRIPITIAGNAGGVSGAGATLGYMVDGTPMTATAGSDGAYSLTVYWGWSGTVTPSKVGYVFNPPSKSYSNLQANASAQNYTALAAVTISGNAGIGGATLSYTGGSSGTATAGSGGAYSIIVASGWTGSITPSKPDYTFTPTSIIISTPVTSNLPNQDFTARRSTYRIFLPLVVR